MIDTRVASDLLRGSGKKLSPQRVAVVLSNIGYIKHPALERSGGKVRIDGTVHRLYVKRGSLTAQLTTSKAVADAWRKLLFLPVPTFEKFQAGSE